jgi:hypothetical protein
MTIQYASDLHLEMIDNRIEIDEVSLIPAGDVLVLAGDIAYYNTALYRDLPFWDWASANFKQTLVVSGNHEFYKSGDVGTLKNGCIAEIRHNVKCYYNTVVAIDDVDFILCTLWANIPPENQYVTQQGVSDFYQIAYKGLLLTASCFNQLHKDSVKFLRKALKNCISKHRVVVSHHVSTYLCMANEFNTSRINGAFAAELHDFIFDSDIDVWIYRYSHRNMPEIDINGTRMLCNQLGYVKQREHTTFNRKAIIDL